MTRAEYEAKYGVAPVIPSAQPIKMTRAEYEAKYGVPPDAPKKKGTLLSPLNEGIEGLKTLYGGGEQGIARKLVKNVQEAASDIQEGDVLKGVAKAGFRTAGDVAGTIYAPVGAAIGATGIGKVYDYIGELSQKGKYNPINLATDSKMIQDFVATHPNLEEDFGRALNLAFSGLEKGTIDPKTVVPRTIAQMNAVSSGVSSAGQAVSGATSKVAGKIKEIPTKIKGADVFSKDVATLRAEKVTSGYMEQNARLKSVEKAFNKNTKTVTNPDGTKSKITPVDTLAKYDIAPEVNKGTIQMGDYQQRTGALGKIRENVSAIETQLDDVLSKSKKSIPINSFAKEAIAAVKADGELIRAGKVASTVKKLESTFDDYRQSYGEKIPIKEVNSIRKTMNKDFNLDTMDASRVVGDVARKAVYKANKNAQPLLAEQGNLLAAKKYAETLNNTKVTGGRLGNYVMRTGGAVLGTTLSSTPIVGPVAGMIGGEYLARAMQQTQFKSIGAEAKAILQRSKRYQPSQSANVIPNSSIPPSIQQLSPEVQRFLKMKGKAQ